MMWFKVNIKNNVVEAEAGLIDLLMGGRRSKPFNHGCGFSMSCSFRTTDRNSNADKNEKRSEYRNSDLVHL